MKITLDLGGTNIRAAIVENGICRNRISESCKSDASEEVVIKQITDMIASLLNVGSDNCDGIGIGVPSIVDPREGIVYNACNIPSWKEVHLKETLQTLFNIEVRVNNDCNCFALGETYYGAGKGYSDVVGVTLGTGIGCGLIFNGKLHTGIICGAGEMGSLPYLDSDYEHYCSSLWLRDKHSTSGAQLAARAADGDIGALKIWEEYGRNLGEFTKAILFAYAPQIMVVGGGIAAAMPYFIEGWKNSISEFPYPEILRDFKMVCASQADANLLGASLLF